MKILFVHNKYQQAGGEQTVVDAQIKLLRDCGHEVILCHRDNFEIKNFTVFQKAHFFLQTIYSIRTVKEIEHLIKVHRPDIAHVHNVFPLISPSVYWALARHGIPIVQTVHNFRFLCPNGLFFTHGRVCERCKMGRMVHAVRYRCYRNSLLLSGLYALAISLHRKLGTFQKIDRFLVLNSFTSEKMVESSLANPEKIRIVPNFIFPYPNSGQTSLSKSYAVYMGRLSEEKGVGTLLNSLRYLPDLQLFILGNGPMEARLRQEAAEFGERVHFTGFVGGDQKWSLLQGASLFIIPSICYEQFPVTVLEGMDAGAAVIASNIGGLPSLVQNGINGLLFEPGNSSDLASKIQVLLDDPVLANRLGQNGRQMAAQLYSPAVHAKNLLAVYQDLQASRKSN